MKKRKTLWLYLDGKRHCDVLKWALGANMTLQQAKKHLADYYKDLSPEFRLV